MEQNQHSASSPIYIVLIILFALIIDIVQLLLDFIPIVGWVINIVIDVIAGLLIYFLLKAVGIKMRGAKKRTTFVIGLIANAVPFVGSIASWTVDVILLVILDKAERKLGVSSQKTPENDNIIARGQQLRQNTAQNLSSGSTDRFSQPNRMPLRNPRLR